MQVYFVLKSIENDFFVLAIFRKIEIFHNHSFQYVTKIMFALSIKGFHVIVECLNEGRIRGIAVQKSEELWKNVFNFPISHIN